MALRVDDSVQYCYLMKCKAQPKMQRRGRYRESRFFDDEACQAWCAADKNGRHSWGQALLQLSDLQQQSTYPAKHSFPRPNAQVPSTKNKDDDGVLAANTRLAAPGDVDPDGEMPVEDGGVRTDDPACPQLAFQILCPLTVRNRRRMCTF